MARAGEGREGRWSQESEEPGTPILCSSSTRLGREEKRGGRSLEEGVSDKMAAAVT